jgi:hypothetical protein
MTALRTLWAAGGAAALLLTMALPADAQVIVHRGINPWTGHAYRNVTVLNPWTGRVGTASTVVNPWTGAPVRSARVYNTWSGRPVVVGGVVNPWTNQPRLVVHPRRRWW